MSQHQYLQCDDVTFEVVDKIPGGNYEIWNIGANMINGYVPFCRMAFHQPFPGSRQIDVNSLKAVKTDGAEIIMQAARCGCSTIKKMGKYLDYHKDAAVGTFEYQQCERIRSAMPFLKEIC